MLMNVKWKIYKGYIMNAQEARNLIIFKEESVEKELKIILSYIEHCARQGEIKTTWSVAKPICKDIIFKLQKLKYNVKRNWLTSMLLSFDEICIEWDK